MSRRPVLSVPPARRARPRAAAGRALALFRAGGCRNCRGTGYFGRQGVFELLSVDDPIRDMVLERAPSAELRPDQQDTDSLPPYDVLDPILEAFIEEDLSVDEIAARGFDRATVGRVLEMVKRNEYKRRQAPPGIRISGRAFGRDWRYPITSGYQSR